MTLVGLYSHVYTPHTQYFSYTIHILHAQYTPTQCHFEIAFLIAFLRIVIAMDFYFVKSSRDAGD